jgi:hypothetical protein
LTPIDTLCSLTSTTAAVIAATGDASFYATAVTILVGFLVTWLVAEARGMREEMSQSTGDELLTGYRIPRGTVLPIAFALAGGGCLALRAEYRGHAAPAENIAIWAAVGLGFAGVSISVAQNVLLNRAARSDRDLAMRLSVWKRAAPVVVALVFGIFASPLVRNEAPLTGTRFPVYGTCLTGDCGLVQRFGPGPQYRPTPHTTPLDDGTMILVRCQTKGRSPKDFNNPIWDKIAENTYVSDAYVRTPNRSGDFSSGIAHCQSSPRKGPAG